MFLELLKGRRAPSGEEGSDAPKIEPGELNSILDELKKRNIPPALLNRISGIFALITNLCAALESAGMTIKKLQKIVFGSKTESNGTRGNSPQIPQGSSADGAGVSGGVGGEGGADGVGVEVAKGGKKKKGGHKPGQGRYKESDYLGAKLINCFLPNFISGITKCTRPGCVGTMQWADAARFLRMIGQAPLVATRYAMEVARCNVCGLLLKAPLPEGVSQKGPKYDASCAATVMVMHYGIGVPLNAINKLQSMSEMPVAVSTMWDLIEKAQAPLISVHSYIRGLGANAEGIYIDDTTNNVRSLAQISKILEAAYEKAKEEKKKKREAEKKAKKAKKAKKEKQEQEPTQKVRKAIYTTVILSKVNVNGVVRVLYQYITSNQNAGENLRDLLKMRDKNLERPWQMSDALNVNFICQALTIVSLCNAHARRGVFDLIETYPEECQHLLNEVSKIYANEKHCRDHKLSPSERLAYHVKNTAPITVAFKRWIDEQLGLGDPTVLAKIEPNSSLGKALMYYINHWDGLTQFLRTEDVPIDNNLAERAIKAAIRVRKTSGFYNTEKSAAIGDRAMSLIYTCVACDGNPVHYLTALIENSQAVQSNPALWLPWNYQSQLPPPSSPEPDKARADGPAAKNGTTTQSPVKERATTTAAPANTAQAQAGAFETGVSQTAPAGTGFEQPLQTPIHDHVHSKAEAGAEPQVVADADDPGLAPAQSPGAPKGKGTRAPKTSRTKPSSPRCSPKRAKPQCHWDLQDVWMRDTNMGDARPEAMAQPPP